MVAACCEKDGQQQTQEVLAISNLDPTNGYIHSHHLGFQKIFQRWSNTSKNNFKKYQKKCEA